MTIRVHYREQLDDGKVSAPSFNDYEIEDESMEEPSIIVTYVEVVQPAVV